MHGVCCLVLGSSYYHHFFVFSMRGEYVVVVQKYTKKNICVLEFYRVVVGMVWAERGVGVSFRDIFFQENFLMQEKNIPEILFRPFLVLALHLQQIRRLR